MQVFGFIRSSLALIATLSIAIPAVVGEFDLSNAAAVSPPSYQRPRITLRETPANEVQVLCLQHC